MNDRFEPKRNTSCIDVVQKRVLLEKALPKLKIPLMHTQNYIMTTNFGYKYFESREKLNFNK